MPEDTVRPESEEQECTSSVASDQQDAPSVLIVFRAGEMHLAIDVRRVREVARAIPLSVPLSHAGAVAGMITLRGESTAVVDVDVLLGVSCMSSDGRARMIAVHHEGTVVCLRVDQISCLHEVVEAELDPPPAIFADVSVHWLDYVTRTTGGELIGVVNVGRLLSQVSLAGIEGGAASA